VEYHSTYDGDTFYVNIQKLHPILRNRFGIRVKLIDTPEIRGGSEYEKQMAKLAKEYTQSALSGAKEIHLMNCEKGKYFRLVCDVIFDGRNLAEELLKEKLAIVYK